MIKYLLLVAVLATLAQSQFVCKSGYVSFINITCSVYNSSDVGLQSVTSISIIKTEKNYVASGSFAYHTINTFNGTTLNFVIQSYYQYHYLTLEFQSFNESVDGDYEGVLTGLDYENKPVTISYKFKVNIADLDPLIGANPKHIEGGLTQALTVWCSGHLPVHGLSVPAVVNILFRKAGTGYSNHKIGKLTIGASQTTEATAEEPFDVVSSFYGANGAVFFEIISEPVNIKNAGIYTCDIEATDTKTNLTRHLVKTIIVTATVATKEAIRARLGNDDMKEFYSKIITFEYGLSGVNLSSNNYNNAWKLVQGRVVGHLDHTRQDGTGCFIQSKMESYSTSSFASIDLPGFKRSFCISFYFMAPWYTNIYVKLTRNSNDVFYTNSYYGGSYGAWLYARFDIFESTGPFTVEISSSNYYYNSYTDGNSIAIDDFIATDINCNYY